MDKGGEPSPAARDLMWPDATGKAIADHFGFTPEWLHKLELKGFVERKENGLFDLGQAVRGIVAFYRSPDRRAAKDAATAHQRQARRQQVKLVDALAAAKLSEIDLNESGAQQSMALLRSILQNLRPFDDPSMEAEVRKRIVESVDTTQRAIDAFFASVRTRATNLWTGVAGDLAAQDDP